MALPPGGCPLTVRHTVGIPPASTAAAAAPQDEFQITGSDIGKITECTVRLVEKGLGAAWHFQEIEVLNLNTGDRVSGCW